MDRSAELQKPKSTLKTVEILDRIIAERFGGSRITELYIVKRPAAIDARNKLLKLRERIVKHFGATKNP